MRCELASRQGRSFLAYSFLCLSTICLRASSFARTESVSLCVVPRTSTIQDRYQRAAHDIATNPIGTKLMSTIHGAARLAMHRKKNASVEIVAMITPDFPPHQGEKPEHHASKVPPSQA